MDSLKFLSFLLSLQALIIIQVHSQNSDTPQYVPLYMWDTVKTDKTIPALSRIGKEDLKDLLSDKLANKNTIVIAFVEESLSPEDLTSYDSDGNSVYTKIPNIKKKKHVNYFPYVENPLDVLKSFKRDIVELSYDQAGEITPKPGQMLFFNLDDAKDNEDRTEMLIRHDNIVYSVFKNLVANSNDVVALYTGRQSSWQNPNEDGNEEQFRSRRHLLATSEAADETDAANHTLVNTTQALMYFDGIATFKISNNSHEIVECGKAEVSDNNTIVVQMCLKDSADDVLDFNFNQEDGYWFLNSIYYKKENYSIETNIYAPLRMSYHCISSDFKKDFNGTIVTVSIPKFQVQAFYDNTSNKFGDAYDCVGFTTGPIWSGIFVTFILALIMTFGLCMIMDIKTMDRFDDPKGKTISINASE